MHRRHAREEKKTLPRSELSARHGSLLTDVGSSLLLPSRRPHVLLLDQRAQTTESRFPISTIVVDPSRGLLHRYGVELAYLPTAILACLHQIGTLEICQMLRDRLLRDLKRLGQLGNRCGPALESRQDRSPCWIGQGSECYTQRIHNHMVVDLRQNVKPALGRAHRGRPRTYPSARVWRHPAFPVMWIDIIQESVIALLAGFLQRKLVDYYGVLNHLCSLGHIEKMYIPPAIDLSKSVLANQALFEQRCLDWVLLPAYTEKNAHHAELIRRNQASDRRHRQSYGEAVRFAAAEGRLRAPHQRKSQHRRLAGALNGKRRSILYARCRDNPALSQMQHPAEAFPIALRAAHQRWGSACGGGSAQTCDHKLLHRRAKAGAELTCVP